MTLATPTRRMPSAEAVRDFLTDLLGKTVTAEAVDDFDPDDGTAFLSAAFVEDDGRVGGMCICDVAFGAYAGASLALIPRPVADESIAAGALGDNLEENFYEVANIITGLLNGPVSAHLRIRDLVPGVTDEARDLIIKAAGGRSYAMKITDYGDGRLVLFAR